jgi:hypothetical protein
MKEYENEQPVPIEQVDEKLTPILEEGKYITRKAIEGAFGGNKNRARRYYEHNLLSPEETEENPFTTRTGLPIAVASIERQQGQPIYLYYSPQYTDADTVLTQYNQENPRRNFGTRAGKDREKIKPVERLSQTEVDHLRTSNRLIRDEANQNGIDEILRVFSGGATLIQIRRNNRGEILEPPRQPRMLAVANTPEDIIKALPTPEQQHFVETTFELGAIADRLYSSQDEKRIWIMTIDGRGVGSSIQTPYPPHFDEAVDILNRIYGIDKTTIQHTAAVVVELKRNPELREQIASPVQKVYALFSILAGESEIISEESKQQLREMYPHTAMRIEDQTDFTAHHLEEVSASHNEHYWAYMGRVRRILKEGIPKQELKESLEIARNALFEEANNLDETAKRAAEEILTLEGTDVIFAIPTMSALMPLVAAKLEQQTRVDRSIEVKRENEFRPMHYPYALEMTEDWTKRYDPNVLNKYKTHLEDLQRENQHAQKLLGILNAHKLDETDRVATDTLLKEVIFDDERILRAMYDDLIIESFNINRRNAAPDTIRELSIGNTLIADQFSRTELEGIITYEEPSPDEKASEIQTLQAAISASMKSKNHNDRQRRENMQARIKLLQSANPINSFKKTEVPGRIRKAVRERAGTMPPDPSLYEGNISSPAFQHASDLYLAQKTLQTEAERQSRGSHVRTIEASHRDNSDTARTIYVKKGHSKKRRN